MAVLKHSLGTRKKGLGLSLSYLNVRNNKSRVGWATKRRCPPGFNAKRVALIYPGESESSTKSGVFLETKPEKLQDKKCSVITLQVKSDISEHIEAWMSAPN